MHLSFDFSEAAPLSTREPRPWQAQAGAQERTTDSIDDIQTVTNMHVHGYGTDENQSGPFATT